MPLFSLAKNTKSSSFLTTKKNAFKNYLYYKFYQSHFSSKAIFSNFFIASKMFPIGFKCKLMNVMVKKS